MIMTNENFCNTIETIVLKYKNNPEQAVKYLRQLKYPDGSMYISENQAKVYIEVYLKYHYKTKIGSNFNKNASENIKKASVY